METKTLNEIKGLFESAYICELPKVLEKFENDSRQSVKKMISVYNNRYNKYIAEIERIKHMLLFENNYYSRGFSLIAGVDEAGRGPLAGPVVAAAVILPKDCDILYINDSKKLSPLKREALFQQINNAAVSVGIGIVAPSIIDEINIRQATLMAMRKAVDQLSPKPDAVLIDAETVPGIYICQEGIIKGDEKSLSIAAASIIAKVTRDRMMLDYDVLFPGYGFANNKGYGSLEHLEAIRQFGICPIHRKSFTTERKKCLLGGLYAE